MDRSIFRAYDIRGTVPEQINSETMYNIGLYLGDKYKTATVSYDIRLSSPSLSHALISGFMESGGEVKFQGMASFGVALYSGFLERTKLSMLVTASHLPPEYNGLKMYYSNGLSLSSDEISAVSHVENYFVYRKNWKRYGQVYDVDHKKDYISFFASNDFARMKVGVDCGGGSVSLIAEDLFKWMNFDPSFVFCKPNPAFTDRPSEPEPDKLGKLRETIIREGLEFGVAFDGDGDRAVILDDKGNFVPPSYLAILFARSVLSDKGKVAVIANVETSKVIEDVLEPEGAKIVRVPVGHTHLIHYAMDMNADVGVESSGHMILPSILPFDDGVVVPVKLAQILLENGKKLSELVSGLPRYTMLKRKIVFKDDNEKFRVMGKVKEFIVDEYQNVSTLDGVKVEFDDSWVLIRPSNTSPTIKVTVESKDENKVKDLSNEFVKLVEGFR